MTASLDLRGVRAAAAALVREPASVPGWSLAPLVRPRAIVGYVVDVIGQRVVPLPDGTTLLANERRLAEHVFPERWFEASFVLVSLVGGVARVAEARSTSGAVIRGTPLPAARWASAIDEGAAARLTHGGADDRTQRLEPVWCDLDEGDAVVARSPPASWVFVWAE